MPNKPKSGLSLFLKEITEQTSGNLTTEIFWGFLVIGILLLALRIWRISGTQTRWEIPLKIAAIVFIVSWLLGPVSLTFYIVSRNITILRNLVDPIVEQAPVSARKALTFLSTPILPAPQIWHLVLVLGAVILVLYFRRHRRRDTESSARRVWFGWQRVGVEGTETPANPSATRRRDEKPASDLAPVEPKPTDYLVREPDSSALDRRLADQVAKPSEVPAPEPAPPTCKAFNLTWEKAGEKWNPICPHCRSQMGVFDRQPTGTFFNTGGGVEVAVARCSKPGCTLQVGLPQSKANIRAGCNRRSSRRKTRKLARSS